LTGLLDFSTGYFSGRMLRGAGPVPGKGFLVIREIFVNPSGNLSARILRSRIFLTSVSAKQFEDLGSE
jgi:hypothetical protein